VLSYISEIPCFEVFNLQTVLPKTLPCKMKGTGSTARSQPTLWITDLAVFGDSGLSLVVSLLALIVSIWISIQVNVSDGSGSTALAMFATEASLGPIPSMQTPPRIYNVSDISFGKRLSMSDVTSEMHAEFERDGVICLRGLISAELINRLNVETRELIDAQHQSKKEHSSRPRRRGTQFHTVAHSAMFSSNTPSLFEPDSLATRRTPTALMQVALWSAVPTFAAGLLKTPAFSSPSDEQGAGDTTDTLRVIRDIFLAKDDDAYVCGWHVDDMGFWPATPESPGINAWIALDDMELTEKTGGFALAVQSHTAPWRDAAYYWTGASTSFPSSGYHNASHMFAHRTGQGTCNLEKVAPHLHRRMESTKRVYPVKRGDVIFHTRWLFHRTVAIEDPSDSADSNRVYRRYSIRYGPGSGTTIPPGFGTELSVLWNASNGGQKADSVCAKDGPWYPQAWPPMTGETERRFWSELDHLVANKLPIAVTRREARVQEMKPLLKRLAKEQHQTLHGRK
jgi:Phytanoyl-CoA dioxygenase (PhyH)